MKVPKGFVGRRAAPIASGIDKAKISQEDQYYIGELTKVLADPETPLDEKKEAAAYIEELSRIGGDDE